METLFSLRPKRIHIPLSAQILLKSVFTIFLLSGIFLHWWEVFPFFVMLLLLYSFREGLYLKLPLWWIGWLKTIPLLIRFIVAIGASLLLSDFIHHLQWQQSQNSFLPVMLSMFLSLLLIYVICPKETQKRIDVSKDP